MSGLCLNSFKTFYRIYYEDTDAGAIVYYANYLKFAERARTDFLREIGFNQSEMIVQHDILFVVRNLSISYIKPAKLDDYIRVETLVENIKSASIEMKQNIFLEKVKLVDINVKLASVGSNMKPKKIPQEVKDKMLEFSI